jgi:hypothetical protein
MTKMQCQTMKANGMQCSNPAFVQVGTTPMCRLDFNWYLNDKTNTKTFVEASDVSVIDPKDQAELDKLVAFTNMNIPKE